MKPLPMWPLIIPTILLLGIIGYAVVDFYKKEKKKGTWTEYDCYIAVLVGIKKNIIKFIKTTSNSLLNLINIFFTILILI